MYCRVSSFTLKEPTLDVVPVTGSRTSMAPALVVNLPPFPGNTCTSSKSFQVGGFHFEPSGAGRVVVVLHHDAFRIRQAAPVGNHTVVEHGRIPTGGRPIDDLNAVRRRAQQRPNPTGFRVVRNPTEALAGSVPQ